MADGDRFARAVELIDGANSAAGDLLALEHGRLAAGWVARLDPGADEAQLLAAQAHHLRRAAVPRSSYPAGRAGYLRWRRDAKARHAAEVGELLAGVGYGEDVVGRVQRLVRKEAGEPGAGVHEDAVCLAFLATQLDDLAAELGEERAVEVLRKTARKMTPAGLAAAGGLPLSGAGRALLERALGGGEGA